MELKKGRDYTNNKIKVSIIIPCYNHGEFLMEAVASALKSTFKNFEIIIVNDGSTDVLTHNIIKELEQKLQSDKRTRFIHQENLGLADARNNGIRAAKGEYILTLDADNKIRPNYLKETVEILNNNPKIGVVYAYAKFFGERKGVWEFPIFNSRKLLLENYIEACSVYRKRVWEECNGFDPDMGIMGYEDWDLWIGAMERGWKFHLIKKVLFDYRVRNDSMIATCNIPENRSYLVRYICNKHRATYIKNLEYVISEKDMASMRINNHYANLAAKIEMIKQTFAYRLYLKIKTQNILWKILSKTRKAASKIFL